MHRIDERWVQYRFSESIGWRTVETWLASACRRHSRRDDSLHYWPYPSTRTDHPTMDQSWRMCPIDGADPAWAWTKLDWKNQRRCELLEAYSSEGMSRLNYLEIFVFRIDNHRSIGTERYVRSVRFRLDVLHVSRIEWTRDKSVPRCVYQTKFDSYLATMVCCSIRWSFYRQPLDFISR